MADLKEQRKQEELQFAIETRKRSNRLVGRDLEMMEQDREDEIRRKQRDVHILSRREVFAIRREEQVSLI